MISTKSIFLLWVSMQFAFGKLDGKRYVSTNLTPQVRKDITGVLSYDGCPVSSGAVNSVVLLIRFC